MNKEDLRLLNNLLFMLLAGAIDDDQKTAELHIRQTIRFVGALRERLKAQESTDTQKTKHQ
jgi:hypothetical protein